MSNVTTRCPNCRKAYEVPEAQLGQRARCKNCSHKFTLVVAAEETSIPRAASSEEPAAQADPSGKSPAQGPASPEQSPFSSGQPKKIGPYKVVRKLGEGGMGVVWLAYDPALQRDVAVKVLPPEYAKNEHYLKRFLREARAAAKLNHPHTVTIYQVGTDGATVYLAMELVDGLSLDKAVESGRPMEWREATRAIRDAAAGLAAAHEIGLVHRDVKPVNLMRTVKGVTKVVDFGLVRALAADTQLTQQGAFLGTPSYMAPEQWLGQEADARSDLYLLTCAYYNLLTGQAPYQAPTGVALGYQHRYEPFPDPRQLVPDLPPAICPILERGAAKEPADRFQTAAELIADLDELLAAKVTGPLAPAGNLLGTVKPDIPALAVRLGQGVGDRVQRLVVERKMPMVASLPSVITNAIGMKLAMIPAGEFLMGSPHSAMDADRDEKPRHRVRITRPFYLGVTPVTQQQWVAVMGSNPSHFMGSKNPVEQISWDECQRFLETLNAKFGDRGTKYRLPTEAEWEYACRAGSTTRYYFGDDDSALGEYAWYNANSGNTTHPVGEKKPNAWGLYDMHGNVWQWCHDWYGGYADSRTDDPTESATGSLRVLRGGGWFNGAGCCRSASRGRDGPGVRLSYLGLRVSRVVAE